MKNEVTFDQLPLKFRFLIRLLAFGFLGLASVSLAIDGLHNIPHFLLCAVLFAFSLYFLAGSLILFVSIAAIYGGRGLGHCVVLVERLSQRYAARKV